MLIAHTTDLSGRDEIAFEHAVALAARSGSRLASVHASVGPAPERELPEAAELLARWGMACTIVHDRILHQCCDDAVDTLLDAFRRLAPDLVVSATHGRTGIDRALTGSVAEGVARNLVVPTLLLPLDGQRFVDARTGAVLLKSLLVPAGNADEAQQAIDAAARLVKLAGLDSIEIALLHVADGRPAPEPRLPEGFRLRHQAADGGLDGAIVDTANALGVDAVVMVTRGHDAIGDVLLGSHTERALHQCRRPMLWVPLLKH